MSLRITPPSKQMSLRITPPSKHMSLHISPIENVGWTRTHFAAQQAAQLRHRSTLRCLPGRRSTRLPSLRPRRRPALARLALSPMRSLAPPPFSPCPCSAKYKVAPDEELRSAPVLAPPLLGSHEQGACARSPGVRWRSCGRAHARTHGVAATPCPALAWLARARRVRSLAPLAYVRK